jgi:hypothetical protein
MPRPPLSELANTVVGLAPSPLGTNMFIEGVLPARHPTPVRVAFHLRRSQLFFTFQEAIINSGLAVFE